MLLLRRHLVIIILRLTIDVIFLIILYLLNIYYLVSFQNVLIWGNLLSLKMLSIKNLCRLFIIFLVFIMRLDDILILLIFHLIVICPLYFVKLKLCLKNKDRELAELIKFLIIGLTLFYHSIIIIYVGQPPMEVIMFDAVLNVSKATSSKTNKEYTYISVMGLCPDGSYIEIGRLFPSEMELKGIENTLKKGDN